MTQWLHTEPDPRTQVWPLAPWSVHPRADMHAELVAELLTYLRSEVNGWTAQGARFAPGSDMRDWAEQRVELSRRHLTELENLIDRNERRTALLAKLTGDQS